MNHEALKVRVVAGAAVCVGGALALAACFTLRADLTSGGDAGADSAGDATPGDEGDTCSPAGRGCDFIVDRSADAGACSFGTITAAVAAATAQGSSCRTSPTVHVAAGTYTADAGETFPIEVRGVSIEGAGADMTHVSGAGYVNRKIGAPANYHSVLSNGGALVGTFVVGDTAAQTSISGLSIERPPPVGTVSQTFEAIVCDRGNASASPPMPNTTIDHVTISQPDTGVRVTWSREVQSGCNALIINSTMSDGQFGVIADGDGLDDAPTQLVSVQLGNAANNGNTLKNFTFSQNGAVLGGAGIVICDGVTGAVVRGNTIAQDPLGQTDFGIWIVQRVYDPNGNDIEDNTVGPLLNEGVGLMGNVAVTRFVNNRVQGVSMFNQPGYGWLGVGLAIGLEGLQGVPFVAYARNNLFFGNDCAVEFRSSTDPLPDDAMHHNDFGTAMDPGHNTFQCNSGWADNAPGPGGDVWMFMHASAVAPVIVPFEGNVWDHNPPTIVPSTSWATVPRGVDVFEYAVPAGDGGADDGSVPLQVVGGAIDTAGADAAPATCPKNFVPGPP